jgi:hypothetical protein
MRAFKWRPSPLVAICAACLFVLSPITAADAAARKTFATPDEAVGALVTAAKTKDEKELLNILGPSLDQWIRSGDPVADRQAREKFVADYEQKHSIDRSELRKAILIVGNDDFPFPIPLIKSDGKWSFDPEQGKQEIIDRRVGANELDTIETLLAIADAQNDYAELNPLGKGSAVYARRFISTPGKHDGLYWVTAESEPPSPLGELAADAATEGYVPARKGGQSSQNPYHGYYFRMLTGQGPHSSGGAYSYLVNGRMMGGFAVIAWPAKYGASGYKTFMINQDQTVYQSDLGPDTASKVQKIKTFDPDADWMKVDTD